MDNQPPRMEMLPNSILRLNSIKNNPSGSSELAVLMSRYGSAQMNHKQDDAKLNQDRRVQQMILDMITQDGMLNLQAKNLTQ